jgi:hypothetical protein
MLGEIPINKVTGIEVATLFVKVILGLKLYPKGCRNAL